MGFQGDVAGIGLGELLQGLARGGREGVLRLHSQSLSCSLGLHGGQVFLLPQPDEDPEIWRRRSERAWVQEAHQRIDTLRMSEIAFAARLEGLFQLLDAEGVHFRFEPGPLPDRVRNPNQPEGEDDLQAEESRRSSRTPVHCPGVSVEFLLLEYARLSDEGQQYGDSTRISSDDVPCPFDLNPPSPELERFWRQCDGASSVLEIADRLGSPLRQVRATVQEHMVRGTLRLADARELLILTARELEQNRFVRAGSRLGGWVRSSPPGPPAAGEVEMLLDEWDNDRLPHVLEGMASREARRLLRRMDLVDNDPGRSVVRWRELRQRHRQDPISEVVLQHRQLVDETDPEAPSATDLLRLARNMQDHGSRFRAAVMLRAAASRLPESTGARLELGTRMLEVGLVEDGTPWLVEAARTLIENGYAEKAVQPLRQVASFSPNNREVRRLLSQARGQSAQGRRRRRNAIIAVATLVLVSLGAVVSLQMEAEFRGKIAEVEEHIGDPRVALSLLDGHFPEAKHPEVATLRGALVERLRDEENGLHEDYTAEFRDVQTELEVGDPKLGLARVLGLPAPPRLTYSSREFPDVQELYAVLVARLETTVATWPEADIEDPETVRSEADFLDLVDDLEAVLEEAGDSDPVDSLRVRLEELRAETEERRQTRAQARRVREERETLQMQDELLAAARAHAEAGDIDRALATYERLLESDRTGKLRKVLDPEVSVLETQQRTYLNARNLARQGEHASAIASIERIGANPAQFALPWKIVSEPAGATVRINGGEPRPTPVGIESTPGTPYDLLFELTGHESVRVRLDEPADQHVVLSRIPDRHWSSSGSIESLPVAVGDEHVVADRSGNLARLDSRGQLKWEQTLESLGGIARSPVFLPRRPGTLLCITEDGDAWFLDSETGSLEGPWSMEVPPVEGPVPTESGAFVRFEDGRTAVWDNRLRPEILPVPEARGPQEDPHVAAARRRAEAIANGTFYGTDAGLEVLRRGSDTDLELASPWTTWSVTVEADAYRVRRDDPDDPREFAIRRSGDWMYVAWEAPGPETPTGRVWVSDEEGLRAFEP